MSHHPTYMTTGRHGCWATCACGWRSATWRNLMGAQLNFARHLTTTTHAEDTEATTKESDRG